MNRILTYILLSLSLMTLSCRKAENPSQDIGYDRDNIYFFMRDVQYGAPSSKAIIESTETLKNLKLPLRVVDQYAMSTPFDGNIEMVWDDQSQLWPARRDNQGNSVAWQGKDYLFYSFLSSEGNGDVSWSKNVKQADKVTITQPAAYTHDDAVWADFLMSYIVPADGRLKPLVEFEMERITAGVEVYVSTPLDPASATITITDISIDGIRNEAEYSLVHHDNANSGLVGIRNNWVTAIKGDERVYRRTGNIETKQRTTEEMFDQKFLVMRFVTVPQPVNGKLTIDYTSNGRKYTQTFDLSLIPSVRRWERGRKARYYVNIDTSVGLEANVAEWISVDYIEGTFLPWLPDDDE